MSEETDPSRGPAGWTPLHAAIEAGDADGDWSSFEALLTAGADVNAWDADRDATPLLMAVFRGAREAAARLLQAGADPDIVGAEGDTPVLWAVSEGDEQLLALLLAHPLPMTLDRPGGAVGATPLAAAIDLGRADLVERLLGAGACRTARDHRGLTPTEALTRAARRLPPERVRSLRAMLEPG